MTDGLLFEVLTFNHNTLCEYLCSDECECKCDYWHYAL